MLCVVGVVCSWCCVLLVLCVVVGVVCSWCCVWLVLCVVGVVYVYGFYLIMSILQ